MQDATRERQLAEAESLEAIFPDEFSILGTWRDDARAEIAYTITLDPTLAVRCRCPVDYPDEVRLQVELLWSGVGDIPNSRAELADFLESLPLGDEMAYTIVTWCQDRVAEGIGEKQQARSATSAKEVADDERQQVVVGPDIVDAAQGTGTVAAQHGSKYGTCLPLSSYFRAEALGEGACGSVMHVYDEDGQEWAAKQFERAEDDGVDTTTLREIGLLRALFACERQHPNIVRMVDMASINGELCMIMASYNCSLKDALSGGVLASAKGSQLRVSGGLLSAVAFLHASKTMHRDIKPGNIMLTSNLDPVLIDFSLGKLDFGSTTFEERVPRTAKERRRKARGKTLVKQGQEGAQHSQGVGTPMYMAPEVCGSGDYGTSADMWSVGVVLLEVFDSEFCTKLDQCEKEKVAHTLIRETVGRLGTKPIPALLRALLDVNPSTRILAAAAFQNLLSALPQGSSEAEFADISAVQLVSMSGTSALSGGESVSEIVASGLQEWAAFFRCSGRVRRYAEIYAAQSPQAREVPLFAVILAGRLHESDMEAPPFYDLEELAQWAYEEEDEELVERLCDSMEGYIAAEQVILRNLDYVLY